MALVNKDELKQRFLNGQRPDQDDFADLIDSCYGFIGGISLSSSGTGLEYSTLNADTGAMETDVVTMTGLILPIEFNNQSKFLVIGGQDGSIKVGLKRSTPKTDLDINGFIALQYGSNVNEITSDLLGARSKESSIPTTNAVIAHLETVLQELRSEIEELKRSALQRMIDVAFPPSLNPIHWGPGKIQFNKVYFKHDPEVWKDNSTFVVPEKGRYRVTIHFEVDSAFVNQGSELFLDIHPSGNASPRDPLYYLDSTSAGKSTIHRVEEFSWNKDELVYISIGVIPQASNDRVTFSPSNNRWLVDFLYQE